MSREPAAEEELEEILRRGRFEDLALLTSIGAMVGITIVVVVIQLGAPTELLIPAIGILGPIAIVAAVSWAVGNIRTNRALNRAISRFEPQRRRIWPYVFSIGVAGIVGVAFWFATDPVRHWLWIGWVVASIVAYFWIQSRTGHRRSRRR